MVLGSKGVCFPMRRTTNSELVRTRSDDLLQLQGIVNSLVNVLEPAGLATTDVSYAAYFSTQSTEDALSTVKQLNIAPYAQAFQATLATGADFATANALASEYLPNITTELTTGPDTVLKTFLLYCFLLIS
jgi:hypothetical protein